MKCLWYSYTGFDKVRSVRNGNDSIRYAYGYDHQRIRMEERVQTLNTYLVGPFGVFAVVTMGSDEAYHYVLKDNLGSWVTITDKNGTVEQQLSYDAWGNLRNPNNWANYTLNDIIEKPMFDRGFTGHEHLCHFSLINMNGRMYDPVVSSFLSADRYVQDPTSAMGFNRYAYCMYNPLRFVDPTGWLAGSGNGSSPDDPPPYVVFEGWASGYLLDEVTVTATPLFYDEFVYTPYYYGGGGSDQQWSMVNNSQPTIQCGGGGGGNHGGNTNNTTSNQNINIDIASKMLIVANLYTSIESKSYFNLITKKWKDKLDIIRDFDFHGNQYTGGKNSFGKMMSQKFNNAGRVFGSLGVLVSIDQCLEATSIDGQFEYGLDAVIGFAGVVAPEFFGLPSTIWFWAANRFHTGMDVQLLPR